MQLRADVTGAGGQEAAHSPTSSPGAYELYLRGRHALSRATVPEIQRAIDLFQRALGVDPTYPQAYAGLADSYLGLSGMYLKPRDAMTKAKAAAARALELDPKLPEAHVSNGVVLAFYDFDWEGSAAEFRRAIELNPQDAGVRLWYAWNLVLTGHGEAGIAEAPRARELDPLSAFVETGLAQMYYCSGQPSEAIQRLRVVVATDPGFFNGHYYLGVAYVQNGQYAEAIAELQEAERLDPQQPQPIAYLVYALARLGRTDAARGELARLNRMSNERYVSAYLQAVASAGLEQREETIRWLTTAHDDRDDMLAILRIERALSDVQTDQRIVALLQKIGLGPG
jgi:tetratricopeptide (TPR) repeat protein